MVFSFIKIYTFKDHGSVHIQTIESQDMHWSIKGAPCDTFVGFLVNAFYFW